MALGWLVASQASDVTFLVAAYGSSWRSGCN